MLALVWLAATVWDAIRGERTDAVFWTGFTLIVVALVGVAWLTVRAARRFLRTPDPAVEAAERGDPEALALLDKHRPLVRVDRQYDYRLLAAESAVENEGNLLRRFEGDVIAGGCETPPLNLALLTNYPSGLEPRDDDCISMAPDHQGDARRWERRTDQTACVYGRVVEDGNRIWLQYWFWLYYNPKHLFGFGKHEGDWEMVQIGLSENGDPEVATYAQHDHGETRKFQQGSREMDLAGDRPIVYIAPYSHASYFKGGVTHPYAGGIDQAVYAFEDADPPVVPFGEWVCWKGRWGNSERTIARRIGNGPRSPAWQRPKWSRPETWHKRMGRRRPRVALGRAVHWLGTRTFPPPPELESVQSDGDRLHVRYRLGGRGLRRARHMYLTVHDGPHVIATRMVRNAAPAETGQGAETLLLSDPLDRLTVYASAFNWLRQRSNLSDPRTNQA